jgi:tetraacyldisaccharide 4'-kinase
MSGHSQEWTTRLWYGRSMVSVLLVPLSWLYLGVVSLRRWLYARGMLRSGRARVPVIVIGNISVGGTGKTPVCVWMAERLVARGFTPGVVSRGYRGQLGHSPLPVLAHSDPAVVGDEPVLIAERCGCPVVVHPDRLAAVALLEDQGVDIIIADDGLQHYALQRDIELAVVDAARGFGNGRLLPAGPLREPIGRLAEVDRVLINAAGRDGSPGPAMRGVPVSNFTLRAAAARRLRGPETRALASFAGTTIHAVAAIGNPQRFFDMLRGVGAEVIPHAHDDHARLHVEDLNFDDGLAVLITEKDAVKCRHLDVDDVWYVPVDAVFDDESWFDAVLSLIRQRSENTDD